MEVAVKMVVCHLCNNCYVNEAWDTVAVVTFGGGRVAW